MIEREQAEHNSQNIYYRSTIGAVEAGSILQLGLRLKTREDIRQVLLRLWQEGKGEKLYPLTTDADMEAEEKFYKTKVPMPETGCLLWYYFIIVTSTGTFMGTIRNSSAARARSTTRHRRRSRLPSMIGARRPRTGSSTPSCTRSSPTVSAG